jgi:hypothetical protein
MIWNSNIPGGGGMKIQDTFFSEGITPNGDMGPSNFPGYGGNPNFNSDSFFAGNQTEYPTDLGLTVNPVMH